MSKVESELTKFIIAQTRGPSILVDLAKVWFKHSNYTGFSSIFSAIDIAEYMPISKERTECLEEFFKQVNLPVHADFILQALQNKLDVRYAETALEFYNGTIDTTILTLIYNHKDMRIRSFVSKASSESLMNLCKKELVEIILNRK